MSQEPENRIVEGILGAISEHRLKAGAKLGEQVLCEIYGCSRAEVRRALITLSAHRVVDLHKNRGAFVAIPTKQDARNVFQARRAIEKTLVRNAARLASAEQLRHLREHVDREISARQSGNRRQAIRLSGDFHLILGEVGCNEVLLGFLRDLVMRSSLIIGLYATVQEPLCEDDDHRGIIEAVARRDQTAANDLMDAHLRRIEAGIRFERDIPPDDLREILASG